MKEATLSKHESIHWNSCYGDTTLSTEEYHRISCDWRDGGSNIMMR